MIGNSRAADPPLVAIVHIIIAIMTVAMSSTAIGAHRFKPLVTGTLAKATESFDVGPAMGCEFAVCEFAVCEFSKSRMTRGSLSADARRNNVRFCRTANARSVGRILRIDDVSPFLGAAGVGIGKKVLARLTELGSIFSSWISFSFASGSGQARK